MLAVVCPSLSAQHPVVPFGGYALEKCTNTEIRATRMQRADLDLALCLAKQAQQQHGGFQQSPRLHPRAAVPDRKVPRKRPAAERGPGMPSDSLCSTAPEPWGRWRDSKRLCANDLGAPP